MIWSSNDPGFEGFGSASGESGLSMNWTWQDLASDNRRNGMEISPEVVAAQRDREREEAYERGFSDGVAAGRSQALKDLQPNLQASVKVVTEVEDFQTALLDQMQADITALALAVGRQLMEREVRAEPEVVANLVRNALSHFPLDQKLRIRLHPADLSGFSREQSGGQAPLAGGREVRWVPDETVSRGGCLVEGPERIVDGRVEVALERIYRTVTHG